jgi:hypothetical protein
MRLAGPQFSAGTDSCPTLSAGSTYATPLHRDRRAKVAHSSLCAVRLQQVVVGTRVNPVDPVVTCDEEGRATACVCQPAHP